MSLSLNLLLYSDAPSVFVVVVMDITDVIHGKTEEDKQHFIPFQQ